MFSQIGAQMDPDAALAEFRQALRDWQTASVTSDAPAQYDALVRAVTSATALDAWLSRGGFLPAAWTTNRTATERNDSHASQR